MKCNVEGCNNEAWFDGDEQPCREHLIDAAPNDFEDEYVNDEGA